MSSRSSAPPSHRHHTLLSDVVASLCLLLYSLVVVAGFARVFAGWDFFDNLAVIVVVGHGAGLLTRRILLPGWIAIPVVFALVGWVVLYLHAGSTFSYLLPTSETFDLVESELELVREQFRVAVAPVLFGAGWDVLAGIGVGLAVLLSDSFAFRAGARAEALVPGGVLFVFVSAVGIGRLRIELAVLLVTAGALATIALRRYHTVRLPLRMVRRRSRPGLVTLTGMVMALLIGVLAGFVGPALPGAYADPLIDTTGRGAGGSTTLVSPLVDIRTRLTNQGNVELFVMEATADSYWRTSTLPEFDGVQWKIPDTTVQPPAGDLATGREGSTLIDQTLRIGELTGNLIPAAPDLLDVRAPDDEELRWSAETDTLLATGDGLTAGAEFSLRSASPRFTATQLARATSATPPDAIYLGLPDDFPDWVRETTLEVTGPAASSYEAALLLQHWFRDENEFTYSLEAQSGHGNNALEVFLNTRVGYCEQFAGAFGAMLRSIGIPTRLAVGFTPGRAVKEGVYSVLGKNAHAWPEVWFDDLGWVPFEPTPGRGAPRAANYTGVLPDQDDSGIDQDAGDAGEGSSTGTTIPGDIPFEEQFPVPIDSDDDSELPRPQIVEQRASVPWFWLGLIAAVALAAFAPAIVRRLRRHAPVSSERELGRLWTRAVSALAEIGVAPSTTDTPVQVAVRASERFPTVARPMTALADVVTSATYSKDGLTSLTHVGRYGTSELRRCANWTRQVERGVLDSLSPRARIRHHFTTWS